MGITENAAYLKGLFDGFEIDTATKEGKIIGKLLDLVSDMAESISELEAECAELREYVEELDHDLGEVEEEVYYGYADDEDYDDLNDDEDFEGEMSDYYEIDCPSCGETVFFDDTLDPDEMLCPACGEKIGGIEICDGNCDACDDADCNAQE